MKKYLHYLPIAILALTLPYKFTGNGLPYLVEFFNSLGLDGMKVMVGIGIQEAIIIGLLLSKKYRKIGALGAVATMLGAIFTHAYLGEFDIVFAQAWVVLASSLCLLKNKLKEAV